MLDAARATLSFASTPLTISQRWALSIWAGRMRQDRSAPVIPRTL